MRALFIIGFVAALAVVMIACERLKPGRIWPKVPGWWSRALLLTAVQVGSVYLAGLTYDRWTSTYWARTPYPTASGIQAVLDNVSLEDPRAAQANPADFYDDRFVRELDESGYIRRLYE